MEIEYSHKFGGGYAETIATIDGNKFLIDTQHEVVLPLGDHADDCDQLNKMGGRCTCGKLDGIDIKSLILDARKNGKLGQEPYTKEQIKPVTMPKSHVCPKCQTYCFGDCEAN